MYQVIVWAVAVLVATDGEVEVRSAKPSVSERVIGDPSFARCTPPILPHASEQIHSMLGYGQPLFGRQYTERVEDARGSHLVLRYDHTPATGVWKPGTLTPGQSMNRPSALFVKLDDELMAARLGAT